MSEELGRRGRGKLAPDGKPMRALRSLVGTDSENPITEADVWRLTKRGGSDTTTWHDALAKLVKLGLAKRCGRRGGYQWYITDAGRDLITEPRTKEEA